MPPLARDSRPAAVLALALACASPPAEQVAGRMTRVGAELTGLREGTPVVVGAGDVPASQLGSGAVNSGDTHLSLGTAVYFAYTMVHPERRRVVNTPESYQQILQKPSWEEQTWPGADGTTIDGGTF